MVVGLHQIELKRRVVRIVYVIVSVILILGVTRFSGLWTFGRMSGSSMSPTLKTGEFFFAIKAFDLQGQEIVAYQEEGISEISIGRIIGIPGDTILIINGLVYRNGIFIDDTLNLDYTYKAAVSELAKVPQLRKLTENGHIFIEEDSFSVNLSPRAISENKICAKRITFANKIDPAKFNLTPNAIWTADNFGPILVPEGKYFILCDNRGNSFDSRHRGYIPQQKIKFRKL